MPTNRETLLCRYHYDPLDRLADCTRSAQVGTQRFYLKTRLSTEIQGAVQRSIFQQENQLLAQKQHQDSVVETTLLAADQHRSVLHVLYATQLHSLTYTPYGHRAPENGWLSLLGFNGERPDPVTGHYVLGNGYRAFNPVLMRFNNPDSWSPFGNGGLNAYAYCMGDPVNREDRTGHSPGFFAWVRRALGKTPGFNKYTHLNKSSTSLANSTSINGTTLADNAGQTRGATEIGTTLLKIKDVKTINNIQDPIPRNQAKLSNVKNELTNLKTNENLVVRETMDQNSAAIDFMGPDIYESIVRSEIPKRINYLEQRILHYTTKISKLTNSPLTNTNRDVRGS